MDMTNIPIYNITKNGKMMILGIGRLYTASEKKEIRCIAKVMGFKVPANCSAGMYFKVQ